MLHIILHFIVPGIAAILFFRDKWWHSWLIMGLAIIIDLDHLLATPIFDPNRCSIGFHLLHSYIAIGVYLGLCLYRKTRILGAGLMIHIILDFSECVRIDKYNF